jgi:hypothetical protein
LYGNKKVLERYLLPFGPRLGGGESSFLVGRVELSMVCENHVVPFCFRDWSEILIPVEGTLKEQTT